MPSTLRLLALVAALSMSACPGPARDPDDDDGAPRDDELPALCGDGACDPNESCTLCPIDCPRCTAEGDADGGASAPACDDGECNGDETCSSCEADCGACEWPPEWVALEDDVLTLVNGARASGASCPSGPRPAVPALSWDHELAVTARRHSLDMAEQGFFDHISLDGRWPSDRADEAGYTGAVTGENIAGGSSTAAQAFDGWMNSEGHCQNIMSSGSTEIGIGYAFVDGSPWSHYWTQVFGVR